MEKHKSHFEEKSLQLAEDIKLIFTQTESVNIIQKPSLSDWLMFVEDFLGVNFNPITDELIQSRLKQIDEFDQLKNLFPQNSTCCVTIIPCDTHGNPFFEPDIKSGEFLTNLLIFPPNKSADSSIFKFQKLLFEFMPDEIQNSCSFKIASHQFNQKTDQEKFLTETLVKYARALKNLQALCKLHFKK